MTRYFRIIISLLLVGIALTACHSDNHKQPTLPKEITIKLSATRLTFDRNIGTKEVTVEATDCSGTATKWIYTITPQVEWLIAKATQSGVSITTSPNLSGEERRATVAIISGTVMEQIAVKQEPADLILEIGGVVDKKLQMPTLGGEKYIKVSTNATNWEVVAPGVEWLEVTPFPDSRAIKVVAAGNPLPQTRSAELVIKLPDATEQRITVEQMGSTPYFIPILSQELSGTNKKHLQIISQEEARGHKLANMEFPKDSFKLPLKLHFITASELLPMITYSFDATLTTLPYKEVLIQLSNPDEMAPKGAYLTYLKEQGFTEQAGSTSTAPKLISADGTLAVSLVTEPYRDGGVLTYVKFATQQGQSSATN